MRKITITNMTGARNGGCEALVTSIIDGIEHACGKDQVSISLDSGDSQYDSHVFSGRVKGVFATARLPRASWPPLAQRGSYMLMGAMGRGKKGMFGSVANLRSSDLLVATGGDVFTSDYGGLSRHARTLQVGTDVALLGQTIGPFTPAAEAHFRQSLRNIALCTVRESKTLEYLSEKFPELKVEQTADVAFLLKASSAERARSILEDLHGFKPEGRPLVGLSISSGIMSFRSDVTPDVYIQEIAGFIDDLNKRGYSVILIPHVQERNPSNNDIYACVAVMERCQKPAQNLLLSLTTLSASDYKAVIGRCDALIGARTHATIASMSQGIPTVSIAYSRKAWGIMRDYYGQDLGTELTIDVAELSRSRLMRAFEAAIANGETIETADEMKRRAAINFERIAEHLELRPAG